MKSLQEYIVVIQNIIPDELCDAVLAEYQNCNDWINAVTGSGENLKVRNCMTIGLSFSSVIEKNFEVRQSIDKELFLYATKAIHEYRNKFSDCKIERDYGYDLLKYSEGEFYIQHTDSFLGRPSAVSCSFALNDEYVGGEFAFFDRELVYKLKKGSCIMFPSNFMYPHEIMPVTSGQRYSIVTWFV